MTVVYLMHKHNASSSRNSRIPLSLAGSNSKNRQKQNTSKLTFSNF